MRAILDVFIRDNCASLCVVVCNDMQEYIDEFTMTPREADDFADLLKRKAAEARRFAAIPPAERRA